MYFYCPYSRLDLITFVIYTGLPTSKDEIITIQTNISSINRKVENNDYSEFELVNGDKTKNNEEDHEKRSTSLMFKLVERTNKFLKRKNISLGLSNETQKLIVKSLLSTITENINFLRYDFWNGNHLWN